jgi:hypothetical protein
MSSRSVVLNVSGVDLSEHAHLDNRGVSQSLPQAPLMKNTQMKAASVAQQKLAGFAKPGSNQAV